MFQSHQGVKEKDNEDEENEEDGDLEESREISSRAIPPKYWSAWQSATEKLELRQTKKQKIQGNIEKPKASRFGEQVTDTQQKSRMKMVIVGDDEMDEGEGTQVTRRKVNRKRQHIPNR